MTDSINFMEVEETTIATCTFAQMSMSSSRNNVNNQEIILRISKRRQAPKRKYKRRSAMKFLQTPEDYQLLNPNNFLEALPLYRELSTQNQFIVIGCDFIFHLNHQLPPPRTHQITSQTITLSKHRSNIHYVKEIIEVNVSRQFLALKLTNKVAALSDFRKYILTIHELLKQVSGGISHLELLFEFQDCLDRWSSNIRRIISNYEDKKHVLEQLHERRQQYKKEIGLAKVEKTYRVDEDFLLIGFSEIDFNSQLPSFTSMQFNKPLAALIGSNFEELQAFFLRKGLKEFFDFETRLLFQQQHIRSMISQKNEFTELPFTLITYDAYSIPCRIRIESMFIQMPNELKYYDQMEIEDHHFDVHEVVSVMQVLLANEQIQEICTLRAQNEEENSLFQEDICYSIQSECFLEKFYPNEYKMNIQSASGEITVQSSKEQRKQNEDPFSHFRCKYQPIQPFVFAHE